MTQPLIDRVLHDARIIIADRRRRLRDFEAVGADGRECDPCGDEARRFCAVGALIHAAYCLTGDHDHAHRLGWQIASMIADAAKLRCVDGSDGGWALAFVNDTRGQAAVLRAVDALIGQRRKTTPLQAVCAECFGEITRREGRALNTTAEWSAVLNKNQ
jgi:hypothetical protein